MSIMSELRTVADLLQDAAYAISQANSERDLTEQNYQAQRRNTLAFKEKADRRLELLRHCVEADSYVALAVCIALAKCEVETYAKEPK